MNLEFSPTRRSKVRRRERGTIRVQARRFHAGRSRAPGNAECWCAVRPATWLPKRGHRNHRCSWLREGKNSLIVTGALGRAQELKGEMASDLECGAGKRLAGTLALPDHRAICV